MIQDVYSKKVMEYFRHPKNYGRIKKPDGVGKVGNVFCGDVMWIYIKVGKSKGKEVIKEIKFETFGCIAAIATSSVICDLAKGKTLNEALKITNEKIAKTLKGLPPIKMHCSSLAADALSEAIYDYLKKQKRPIPKYLEKRHIKVEKDKEMIEARYKDWLKLEEKIHRNEKA
jgi:nitrogen fixation NifU-like protein